MKYLLLTWGLFFSCIVHAQAQNGPPHDLEHLAVRTMTRAEADTLLGLIGNVEIVPVSFSTDSSWLIRGRVTGVSPRLMGCGSAICAAATMEISLETSGTRVYVVSRFTDASLEGTNMAFRVRYFTVADAQELSILYNRFRPDTPFLIRVE